MSDPCNPPGGISDDKLNYLQSLCACKTAANALEKDVDERVRLSQEWSNSHQIYMKRYQDWSNKQGEFLKFKALTVNVPFVGEHCFDRPSNSVCFGRRGPDDYTTGKCREEATRKQLAYADQYIDVGGSTSCNGGGCIVMGGTRGHKVNCGRNPTLLAAAEKDYQTAMPKDVGPMPTDNSNDTIQCCSNYMNLGEDAKSNAQTCLNSIVEHTETKLNEPEDTGGTGTGTSGTSVANPMPWIVSILFICLCFCGAGALIMLM